MKKIILSFIRNVATVYVVIFCAIFPFFVALSPVIIFLTSDKSIWLFGLILTIPVSVAMLLGIFDSLRELTNED